jgi:hypothetical protein
MDDFEQPNSNKLNVTVAKIFTMCERRLTTQAQRPGTRDAMIATATLKPGSLQRMLN